jgi:DNA-binding transcriptional MerR regulator
MENNTILFSGRNEDIEKRVVKVERVTQNESSVAAAKSGNYDQGGKNLFLGKVIFDTGTMELPVSIFFNVKYGYVNAVFPGQYKGSYQITIKQTISNDNMKPTLDIETAAAMVFCEVTGLPQSKRDGGGSCSGCKHRKFSELHNNETGKVERHTVCCLEGMVVDGDWHKLQKHIEETDTGLVGKKEKSTLTYEHAYNSPNLGTKNGRYKSKGNIRKNHTDEVVNCPFYAAWFKTKDEEFVKKAGRELPWLIEEEEDKTNLYINGGEVLIDATKVIDPEEIERKRIDKKLRKLGFGFVQLKKMASSYKTRELASKVVKEMKPQIAPETHEMIVDEIMKKRKQMIKRKERAIKKQIKALGYTKDVIKKLVAAAKEKKLTEDQILAVLNKMTPAIEEKTAEVLAKRIITKATPAEEPVEDKQNK